MAELDPKSLAKLRGMASLPCSTILLRVSMGELRGLLAAHDELVELRESVRAYLACDVSEGVWLNELRQNLQAKLEGGEHG